MHSLTFVTTFIVVTPLIKKQPSNISIAERSDVSFEVRADGMDLVYKWYKNGTPLSNKINIEGSNLATLRIYNVSVESSGEYYCTISGGGHSINSTVAVLTVYKGIVINIIIKCRALSIIPTYLLCGSIRPHHNIMLYSICK